MTEFRDGLADSVAIIGMAGRFPGARNLDEYWSNLRDGVESIRSFADEELLEAGVPPELLRNPDYVKRYGSLAGYDQFDAGFFGFSPREAAVLDPQDRQFLECAWEALEDAGYDPERLDASVGVFGGEMMNTYMLFNLARNPQIVRSVGWLQIRILNDRDFLATHVSYKLNLKGPSVSIQTACSTSLVAIHLACESLLNHECEMALAGGVSVQATQEEGYLYHEGSILSPDGHCRAFDARAGGTVGGSGVGIVALQRLEDALAEGSRIRAVIRGSAVNNDGASKVGFTAPSVDAQAEAVATALEVAGVRPDSIDYVETHGTGTPVGDPVEIAALSRAFRASTDHKGFCAVGSVKSNIGHLDPAAGVAGLIKTVLAMENRLIPPSLHFEEPNPEIDFENSPFYVNDRLADWPDDDGPRRAGVSSLGVGGTNAHLVVEEAPPGAPSGRSRPWKLVALSARSGPALEEATSRWTAFLERRGDVDFADAAYTLLVGRKAFRHRRAVVCRDAADALEAFRDDSSGRILTGQPEETERPVVFLFPGQGSQYVGMARELYHSEATFRKELDRAAETLSGVLETDLLEVLYPAEDGDEGEATDRLEQTLFTQPALFAVEHALARLWMEWGVQPRAAIGHSVGEYVAACLAGVMTLEDTLRLVAARARMMQEMPPGAMLSVSLPAADVDSLLGEELSLAAVNAPSLCVVSGESRAIDTLQARLTGEGIEHRRLHVSHGFHSPMMEPAREALTAEVRRIRLRAPRLPFVSNLTGTWITDEQATDPEYWGRHLRETVQFSSGLHVLLRQHPSAVFLEVGPGHTLGAFARRQKTGVPAVASLPGPGVERSDAASLLEAAGRLWLTGASVDWRGFYTHEDRRRVELPTYPFEHQRFWVDPQADLVTTAAQADWLLTPLWKQSVRPPESPVDENGCWRIVDDGPGFGEELAELLRSRGGAVSLGRRASSADPGAESVVYLADDDRPDGFLDLVESAGEVPLTVVTRGGQDVVGEETPGGAAAVVSLCRSLTVSRSEPPCRAIDLPPTGAAGAATGETLRTLAAELQAETAEPEVALRGRRRWVRTLEPVPSANGTDGAGRLPEGGTCAVAPGLSELGLAVAQHLAREVGARLLLLDRGDGAGLEGGELDGLGEEGSAYRILGADDGAGEELSRADLCLHLSRTGTTVDPALRQLVRGERWVWLEIAGSADGDGKPEAGELSEILRRVLATRDGDHFVVHLPALRRSLTEEAEGDTAGTLPTYSRPDILTPYVPPEDDAERALSEIWQELLAIEPVGIHDNFLELGGHSLLATQMTSRIREVLRVDLQTSQITEAPTIRELAALLADAPRLSSEEALESAVPEIVPNPDEAHEPFPLTDVQQAYWIGRTGAFELGEVATHFYFEIDSPDLDVDRLSRAWRRLIDRHGMLRAIVLPDGRQRMLESVPPYEIEVMDLTGATPEDTEEALATVRERMSHQVIPHDRWPLFELRVSQRAGGWTRVHLSIDLLIADAWSFSVLGRDLKTLYADPEAELPELHLSFRDYVLADMEFRESEVYERALEYWRGRFATLPAGPELPVLSSISEHQFTRRDGQLDAEHWSRIKARAARCGLSQPGVLLAAFSEVLSTWSKSPRFTLTLTLNNRFPGHYQVDDLVGDFTSLILLEVDREASATFEARGQRIQKQLWRDLDHRWVSGVRVLRELASRSRDRATGVLMPVVFTSTLNFGTQNIRDETTFGLPGKSVFGISQTPQIWLDHQVGEDQDGNLVWVWDAVEALFPPGLLNEMASAYSTMLQRLAEDERSWEATSFDLVPEEQLVLRNAVNDTDGPVPTRLLYEPFLEQATRNPDRVAVVAPERRLSYGELADLSARLAHRLREQGAQPNRLIAVVMEKGWEQIVAVLGILRAGSAYLPVDPELPEERLRYLLEHGDVELAVTQSRVEGSIVWPRGVDAIALDAPVDSGEIPELGSPAQGPDDLAYVVFTSGSSGRPKGVMIDHTGALNTILDINERFGIGSEDRVLALSSLSFDLSVYDVFGLLAAGGSVVVPEPFAVPEPARFLQWVEQERITFWDTVPALLQMLVDHVEAGSGTLPESLRLCLMSGDWIPVDLPDRLRALRSDVRIFSGGGATEASIWSILYPIDHVEESWTSIPYGRPMTNQRFYVLDEALEPCPVWVPGHLFIAGVGLAKGYWKDEEKTNAAFIHHPVTGERLYRTGDLGRYLPAGDIEFLGREDTQVKVQGYRIELGEIEAALREHPGISAAVVSALGEAQRNKRLVAYIVPAEEGAPSLEELRDHVAAKVPRYMIPSAFVTIDSLPLTANGKVDRRALPAPEEVVRREERTYTAPRTPVEEAIADCWLEVLSRDRIGVDDNFFELGGDSLLASRVVIRLQSLFPVEVPLRSLFEAPTVAELSDRVEELLLTAIESMPEEEIEEML